MWESKLESLQNTLGTHYTLMRKGTAACNAEVIHAWQSDVEFRKYWNALLAASKFAAFRWETAPFTRETLHRPFEFVLLDCPSLARTVDTHPFAEHFRGDREAVAFSSLGRDAYLVVPCPRGEVGLYVHLGSFVRGAPASQQDELWRMVGDSIMERIDSTPMWLSTAGMGVAWLHVRLDSRPKYYGHTPYKSFASN